MLFPAYPLCLFFPPSLSPFLFLKALELPRRDTSSSWALWKWDFWSTGCSSHLISLVHTLPPPSSMGCREFALGLRGRGAEQEAGTASLSLW